MNIKTLDDLKYKIHKIKVLNENDKKAKSILRKAAEQVMPIMRKRRFSVELLSEFLPANPSLLGLNIAKNSEIKIRLRNKKGSELFHFNDIMGTLLHELAHIVHSRHDKSFYELLDKLILEYNELYAYKNLGYTGKKVGNSKNKSIFFNSNPKVMAAQAAEKRLMNNFINKDGKIINLSLESCLTEEQRENLFKSRTEYDDKICSVNNDVIIIDPVNNFYKNKENENFVNYMPTKKDKQLPTNSINTKYTVNCANSNNKNKNYLNSKMNINYINKKSYEDNFDDNPKRKAPVLNSYNDDSVHFLGAKKVDSDQKEVKNGNNSFFCDNFYINKNKKRKIIILD
ncbi:metallopeptidase, putative [Plasmodium gallinaceum]|uniref:Metallopeptidase, putative n=1 Tax=Plasmodium gallinaceum TaxID=5849 RepID=A0A1J1GNU3_PLAGA|nr:metallopeptidase, putative [Plasmodium gallinaceum]CRG94153.1 metallopeptidase, putative [Plasmodium gallinaceum]